ncbi:MAG: hypothetical protein AAF391_12815 [Bacteroidota bacterium]
MKKLLTTALAIIVYYSANAQYDANALAVLDAMSARFKKMEAFQVVWQERLVNKAAGVDEMDESRRKITVKGKQFVLEIPDVDQILFYNGEVLHRFSPSVNEVYIVEDFDPEIEFDIRFDQIYDIYKDGYKYALLETKSNGDRVVLLNPEDRDAEFINIEMTINSQDLIDSFLIRSDGGNNNIYQIHSIEEVSVTDDFFSFDFKNNPNVEVVK